jgi:hypothetical protein
MFTDLLSLIFNRNLSKRKIEFAFIVHPRNTYDIIKQELSEADLHVFSDKNHFSQSTFHELFLHLK